MSMRRKTLRTWWRLALPGQFNRRSKSYTMQTIPFQEWLRSRNKTPRVPTTYDGLVRGLIEHQPRSEFRSNSPSASKT